MSRVIKFRAWHTGGQYPEEAQMLYVGDNLGTRHNLDCCNYLMQGQPVTLMQFTGLTDKNGVEVFEGDILEQYHFTDVNGKIHTILHRVVWSEKYDAWLCLNCKSNDENDGSCQFWVYNKHPFAVVGNIYQNPELLQTT